MYILMDLVINHCSDQHEWFQKALRDPYGKYGKYFYFEKGHDGKLPTTGAPISAAPYGNRFLVTISSIISMCSTKVSRISIGRIRSFARSSIK